MAIDFVRVKSPLELTNTPKEMNHLLDTARVVRQQIYLSDADETVAYKDLLDRVLEILKKTFEGKEELSQTEGQEVRLIGTKVQKMSAQIERSCCEKIVGFCGEVCCCGDYSWCGFVTCKEMAIFHFVDQLDG